MCEYLKRTGYFTPILHCPQWGNISGKPPFKISIPFSPPQNIKYFDQPLQTGGTNYHLNVRIGKNN